jgi:uncharacterized protein YndB with AHSA1/START domain
MLMENKTMIHAEEGRQDLTITREFDLPVDLLYKAHVEPALFEQWMSHEYGTTRVRKWDTSGPGGWHFQTIDREGNVLFQAKGSFHSLITDQKITRTFEMENGPFDVQIEFLEFESLSGDRSRLRMHSVYRTGALRDQMLKLPFRQGLNMAHDRLERIIGQGTEKSI